MDAATVNPRPSQILSERRVEVLDVLREHGAENPRVFGSVARGSDTARSDIDLLVTIPPARAWDFVSLSRVLSELLGVRVDVVSDRALGPGHESLIAELQPL